MRPKGRLLIIGGAEDWGEGYRVPDIKGKNKNFKHYEILGELLPPEKSKEHRIEIITTATAEPEEMSRAYINAFRKIGFQNIHHISIQSKEEASDPAYIKRIEKTHVVLFTGGDQFRLTTILGGTDIIATIMRRYREDKDFIVAGTSAGAMVMSKLMIYSGQSHEAMLKGDVKITSGFGLIDNCIIDTHFVKRGRFGRLAQAIIMNPTCTGIGLGEDTALIITKGNKAECRGSGMVIIIDGKKMGHTNITYAEEYTPLCVENLRVHVLARGDGYLIKERRFIIPKKEEIPGKLA
ncbi:MAG: cyanophycinase [Bacteroidota bacterium]